MNPISNAEQDYLAKKTELEAAQQNEAEKRGDIVKLEQRQNDIESELSDLNQKLKQAGQAMANGDMSSDDYIALKRLIADKNLEREAIGEAIVLQNGALQMLVDHSRNIGHQRWRQLAIAAGEIKQRALASCVEDREQHLKVFVLGVAAHYLNHHPFTGQEKTEQAQLAYQIIGEELCKAVFADEFEAFRIFAEPSLAKSRIEEIISQAA
ncbi:hypothetical protein [Methylomonas albis]|uniref:Uncharacterized protein n=1 Tax=Methylomonas albis TaxID=1854563 RepID=A0ABR9D1P6_9GAMM|nr:hypothetical protein [Methylomonas albis]MBD9356955.1 hypothetical protein [Methylomonas albis]CAD6880145.1 hypothetical protein [Methylomonas albis]